MWLAHPCCVQLLEMAGCFQLGWGGGQGRGRQGRLAEGPGQDCRIFLPRGLPLRPSPWEAVVETLCHVGP